MSKNTATSTREKNVPFEYENAYEEWSTAGIGNTFLFGKVMTSNPNLLLELLQYSLPEFHIQQIENPEKEADVKLSIDAHGVRLDVITTDDQGTDDQGRRIDVEMQMRDEKNIPRRMRYYEGSIDQATLEKGQNYNRLGDVVILFITPFDPFDAHGYYKYTFRNTCQEDKEIVLDDGVTKVILNAAGHKGEITSELKEFLQLVAGNVDPACYPEGSFADRVQRQVHIARRNARWRKEYMDWEMTLRNEREKGREEGRMEERTKTEEQRKRAEAEKERAEEEKERADAAEERIRILEEQLTLLEKGVH